jgi:hypothetical protein
MPGLGPGIHVSLCTGSQDVDGRDKPGHDDAEAAAPLRTFLIAIALSASGRGSERTARVAGHDRVHETPAVAGLRDPAKTL